MYSDKIYLTPQEILDKEFKVDARGYRPQEVDKYLDTIIRDYEEWQKIIKEKERDNKELLEDNIRLKQEIRMLRSKLEILQENADNAGGATNADVLRRLSKLEKIIYGRD